LPSSGSGIEKRNLFHGLQIIGTERNGGG
jgi:hypothetical protein